MAITYDYTPNDQEPFEVATSFQDNLLDLAADEAGYGSLVRRSIASGILKYFPYNYAFDQFYQLFGGMEETPTGVQEWTEADILFEFSANATTDVSGTDALNDATYSADADGQISVAKADGEIFSQWSEIRYSTGSGWAYGYVVDIDRSNSTYDILKVESKDGSTNLVAGETGTNLVVEHITSNLPQDLDYDPQPKQSNPKVYKTFTENYRKETSMSKKMKAVNASGGTIVDLISLYEEELIDNFRAERQFKTLLGGGATTRKQLSNGDVVNFAGGLYEQIRQNDLMTADMTGTTQDASNAATKDAIYSFMLKKFGGESGGPQRRDFFVDPIMGDKLNRAWEDKERFIGGTRDTVFVAGVTVNRVARAGAVMDISEIGAWSAKHPLEDASLRGGSTPTGVGMLIPMDSDHLVRVLETGLGPRQEVFKKNGGDRVMYQRIESNESASLRLIKHCGILEDSDPSGSD